MDQATALGQIDAALVAIESLRREHGVTLSGYPTQRVSEVLTIMYATVCRLALPASPYVQGAASAVSQRTPHYALSPLEGILRALRHDYAAGHLASVTELVHGEVFADFLEMAEYLQSEGYKDAAAVLAGGVLEQHLRHSCQKNAIATDQPNGKPKKAETMNTDLAGASVYSKLDQKNVTA